MTKLSVNLNKIALLRNSRGSNYPDLMEFAKMCIDSGAHGLTIHPRPDQRHARYDDVYALSTLVNSYDDIELNIEGNPTDKFLEVVLETAPTQCTLVPDEPDQLTSDHGWDVSKHAAFLKEITSQLSEHDIRSSLFLDPDITQMQAARDAGADRIELYTESYAKAYGSDEEQAVFLSYEQAVRAAQEAGLGVNAGHDLNLLNLNSFLNIEGILEVSIGHALTVDALLHGFQASVRKYAEIVAQH